MQALPPPYLCSGKTPQSAVAGDCIKTRCSTKDRQLRERDTTDFHSRRADRRDLQKSKCHGGSGMWKDPTPDYGDFILSPAAMRKTQPLFRDCGNFPCYHI